MNMIDRRPLVPEDVDRAKVRERGLALRSVARAALHVCRNAGKPGVERHPWTDDRAIEGLIARSPVSPTRTTDAAVAALAQVRFHFLPSLVPASAAAAVLSETVQVSLDGAASISVPAVSLPAAGFIGEAQAIPVLQGTTSTAATLTPSKLAAIVVVTRELVDSSEAEAIMEQVLLENVGASLDTAFFNANAAVAGVSPAGILAGAITITASSPGQSPMAQDIGKLAAALAPVSGNGQIVIAASPAQAAILKVVAVDPPPIYASNALAAGTVVAFAPAAIASAMGTPLISASRETTLHMAAPAAELVSSPGVVAASSRSIFQTDSLALRFTMDATWAKRGAGVAIIQNAQWP